MRIRDCSSDVCSSDLFVALETSLHEMRLKKSAAELKLMARACALSAEAHCIAMRQTKAGVNEWQIGAEIESHFARNGMEPGYGSIVGGGENACIPIGRASGRESGCQAG